MDYSDSTYTSSKYGIRGLFRSIRDRARQQQNVRCNNIAPWHMKTAQTGPLEKHFQSRGLKEGQGYTFASLDILVEAICQCVVNQEISGKFIPFSIFLVFPGNYWRTCMLGNDEPLLFFGT